MKPHQLLPFWLAGLLILPALTLCTCGILYTGFHLQAVNDWLDSCMNTPGLGLLFTPVVVLGGPALVALWGVFSTFRLHWTGEPSEWVLSLTIRRQVLPLMFLAAGAGLCTLLLLYAFAENFVVVAR